MEIILMDRNFNKLGQIGNANIIWTNRYFKCGDYQIIMPARAEYLELFYQSYFIVNTNDNDNIGVIEDYVIKNTKDLGDEITITGRLSPMVLGKRVLDGSYTFYNMYIQDVLRRLVELHCIDPVKKARIIECVRLGKYLYNIHFPKVNVSTSEENLLSEIEKLCETHGIGFRMPLKTLKEDEFGNPLFPEKKLCFEVYKGVDRSYGQSEPLGSERKNPYIVFSSEYHNLVESEYVCKTTDYKNVYLISNEKEIEINGVVYDETEEIWGSAEGNESDITDLDRNEIIVESSNANSDEEQFYEQVEAEGKNNLTTITKVFSGKVILNNYKYGKPEDGGDFYLGDIVTVKNSKWGIHINARIVEVIHTNKDITLTLGI